MHEILPWLPIIIIFGIPALFVAAWLFCMLAYAAMAIIIIPLELGLRIVGIDTRRWRCLRARGTIDLTNAPSQIFDEEFDRTQVQLDGVRLSDPEGKIPMWKVEETNEYGWYLCSGGARYRVADGRIVEFALGDELVRRTGLLREEQIEMRFGRADRIETTPGEVRYEFSDRHLYVSADSHGEIFIINILL